MDIVLIISCIIIFGMVGIALYLHNQKKITDNFPQEFEQYEKPEIYDSTKFDPSISQHIGWLQSEQPFDNLNLYFDTSNATFFALSLRDNVNKIFLETDIPKDGQQTQVNGKQYRIEFYKNEN
jgi:hypothetical protein